jgi:phenylacetyl-CoA:acceptor oxidoreductase
MNAVLSQKTGLSDEYKLEKGKKYTWEEVSDRMCKFYTNGVHDLEWFKKHGALTRSATAEDQYDVHLGMKALKLRYPIPYMEQVKKTGEELGRNLAEKGIHWWPTEEYTALPTYFPSKLEEIPPEYDFYVTTCRPIMFSYGSNLGLPWMNELGEQLPDQTHILMNTDAAEAKGIKDGDAIWVESEVGKVNGKVTLRQGLRPDTLLIAGQFGQWAMPIAKDTGRVTLSTLLPIDPNWTDQVTGNQQGFVTKAKVYKA